MWPGSYITEALRPGDSILSICCGIGIELRKLREETPITAVDIIPEYIAEFRKMFPWAETHVEDAVKFLEECPDDSYDLVSCIDGIEHLTKKQGQKLLKECKRVCRNKVLIFTPEGYIKNEPKKTWGIDGGDHAQLHLSGWEVKDLVDAGYELLGQNATLSQHKEAYNESMYVYNKPIQQAV